MSEPPSDAAQSPLLRGLFGVLQQAASNRVGTAQVWSDLRTAAGTWQAQAQGLPQPYDPAQLQEAGRLILQRQGINAAAVSTFRGIAGDWRGSQERLRQLGPSEQITSGEIFTPPWSKTASDLTPSRYRVRTQWQFTDSAGNVQTAWRSDEVTGPLTTVPDALSDAEPNADTESGRMLLSGDEPPVMLAYELEQI